MKRKTKPNLPNHTANTRGLSESVSSNKGVKFANRSTHRRYLTGREIERTVYIATALIRGGKGVAVGSHNYSIVDGEDGDSFTTNYRDAFAKDLACWRADWSRATLYRNLDGGVTLNLEPNE